MKRIVVDSGIITKADAAQKLKALHSINPRLPHDAIAERLKLWDADKDEEESKPSFIASWLTT